MNQNSLITWDRDEGEWKNSVDIKKGGFYYHLNLAFFLVQIGTKKSWNKLNSLMECDAKY